MFKNGLPIIFYAVQNNTPIATNEDNLTLRATFLPLTTVYNLTRFKYNIWQQNNIRTYITETAGQQVWIYLFRSTDGLVLSFCNHCTEQSSTEDGEHNDELSGSSMMGSEWLSYRIISVCEKIVFLRDQTYEEGLVVGRLTSIVHGDEVLVTPKDMLES